MKKNIDKKDRIARLLMSILIAVVSYFVSDIVIKIALVLVAIFVLYEALIGWCAFYALIGKNTCPIEDLSNEK